MSVLRRIVGLGTVATFAVVTLGLVAFGVAFGSAALLGAVGVGVVLLLQRLDHPADPDFEHERPERRDGVRGDLQELTWSLVARDGRVGERALRRLKAVAAGRLARHGVALDDRAAVTDLLDERAWTTLTRARSPLPSVADVRHTVTLLDRLGANPGRTS